MPSAERKTWIDPEDRAYPHGGFTRRARVRVCVNSYRPDCLKAIEGKLRMCRAGIPDTFWTIPARLRYQGKTIKGFLSHAKDGEIDFTPERYQTREEELKGEQ